MDLLCYHGDMYFKWPKMTKKLGNIASSKFFIGIMFTISY